MAAESLTLAFELEVFRYLQQPRSVIIGAKRCAQYVGIVTVDRAAARAFGTRHHVRLDFACPIDATDAVSGLTNVRTDFQTNRYVLIGVAPRDVFGGPPDGWEYLTVEQAARTAGWPLKTETVPSERWIRQQIRRFCR